MNHVTLIWIFAGGVFRKSRNVSDRHRRACLWLVFQHLNPIELCGLARVCREWREISEHPSLWKQVTLEDIPMNNMVSRNQVTKVFCKSILITQWNTALRTPVCKTDSFFPPSSRQIIGFGISYSLYLPPLWYSFYVLFFVYTVLLS